MKIYNGEGMILGRLAARVAKDALMGEEVKVVNCEKVVVSGAKTGTFAKAKQKRGWGGHPMRRQVHSRLPDRWVRRSIRGMLPWKQARGKEAFKRIMCYKGLPAEFSSQEIITLQDSSVSKLPNLKYTTIEEVCKHLNGKA
ncbi:MAG TPA: 50S ribosomal protein L13 [Candidatus Nanoarchaeia archaeon]|nr:50S ribosomal protein L13 [Candidatus Nanoarchaeia archaeon]